MMRDTNIVIAVSLAAILAIGLVATVASPVFADSNQIKIQNHQNNHNSVGGDQSNTALACQDVTSGVNTVC